MECPPPIAALTRDGTAFVMSATLYDPINVYKALAANIGITSTTNRKHHFDITRNVIDFPP